MWEQRVCTGPWPSGRPELCDGQRGMWPRFIKGFLRKSPTRAPTGSSSALANQGWYLLLAGIGVAVGEGGLPIQLPCVLLTPAMAPKPSWASSSPRPWLQWQRVARPDLPASLGWPQGHFGSPFRHRWV